MDKKQALANEIFELVDKLNQIQKKADEEGLRISFFTGLMRVGIWADIEEVKRYEKLLESDHS